METSEHTHAGNQITADYPESPYLKGGHFDDTTKKVHPLRIQTMRISSKDGLPEPTGLELTAGEILALSGDYYTKPGWGLDLEVPNTPVSGETAYQRSAEKNVSEKESRAFLDSYAVLTAPSVTKDSVKKIYKIDKSFSDNPSTWNQYWTQLKFMRAVPNYLAALKYNEAHFGPWSTRAYIVGHQTALQYAKVAYELNQLAEDGSLVGMSDETKNVVTKIKLREGGCHQLTKEIYINYSQRYYALAIGMDLACMHYYSDHFAAGHLNRLGLMRRVLPERYGFIGQTLVNSMHNEDNENGVKVAHGSKRSFDLPETLATSNAEGDGTYDNKTNDINAQNMVNGMTASLGEIRKIAVDGCKSIHPSQYVAATTFLPHVDNTSIQYQPMFVLTDSGNIYYRKDIGTARRMTGEAYQSLLDNPLNFSGQYEKLTKWRVFKLFFRLRVATIIPFFWPNPKPAKGSEPLIELPKAIKQKDKSARPAISSALTDAMTKGVEVTDMHSLSVIPRVHEPSARKVEAIPASKPICGAPTMSCTPEVVETPTASDQAEVRAMVF